MKEQNTVEYSYEIIEDLETRLTAAREKVRVLRGEVNQLIGNLEAMGLGHSQEAENARQALAATDPDSPGGQ